MTTAPICATSSATTTASWTDLSERLPASDGWLHSGVTVVDQSRTNDVTLFCAHPEGGALLAITDDETRVIPVELSELHGITSTPTPALIAVADPGYRMTRVEDNDATDPCHSTSPCHTSARHTGAPYREDWTPGRAVLLNTADGSIAQEFPQPDIPQYEQAGWRPTSIAIGEGTRGTEVWIADGYGENLVHRFTWAGAHLATFDLAETGTRLNCPHGIATQGEGASLRILIADRANRRIIAMSPKGQVQKIFGEDHLDSPSSLATLRGRLYVTELHGGVAEFDAEDRFRGNLEAARVRSHEEAAWPNRAGTNPDTLTRPELVEGQFNSPHGLAAHDGNLYLTEWLIGGRLLKLTPASI